MFINLGLVSGASEYCGRQSRPRGAQRRGTERQTESEGERAGLGGRRQRVGRAIEGERVKMETLRRLI